MILNHHSYSPTTVRHYYKIRNLFDRLNIHYVLLQAPRGLQNLEAAKEYHQSLINELEAKIKNPRSRESANFNRRIDIRNHHESILIIESLKKA